jgi:drug/metabolite transporter (DMT)-like permease
MIHLSLDKKSKKIATILGLVAIFIWAIEVVIVSELNEVPLFEALFIIFISSFLFTAARITYRKKWIIYKNHSLKIWFIGILGVCGSDAAYMYAALKAPIIHVDLIDYIWPCLATLFVSFLPNETFKLKNIFACFLGLIGIIILFYDGNLTNKYYDTFLEGYFFAFFGAFIWAVYIAFSRFKKQVPSEMVGLYCGVGALVALVFHIFFEKFVFPSKFEICLCITMGFAGGGLAYQLWDLGIKFGNLPLLNTSTYFARVLAMLFMSYLEKSIITPTLILSTVITILAVFLSTLDISKKIFIYLKNKLLKFKEKSSRM